MNSPTGPAARVRSRRGTAGWAVVVAGLASALLWQQAGPPSPTLASVPCIRAGLVDGALRCDDELPRRVESLCPGPGPRAAAPIRPGDSLTTAQLCARSEARPGEPGWGRMPPEQLAALGVPVDINRASPEELTSLPRIGPTLARRIAQSRPFESIEALLRVRGIGPVTLERLRGRVVVGSPSP